MFNFIGSFYGSSPTYKRIAKVEAGSSATIERGELLCLDTGVWAPVTSAGDYNKPLAIAAEDQTASDVERNLLVIVPKDGDIFECDLDAATSLGFGDKIEIVNSKQVTKCSGGTTFIGRSVSDDTHLKNSTIVIARSKAQFVFKLSNSIF